jgi:hypothetical protein
MMGPITEYLVADHRRIGALLARSGEGDRAAHDELRVALLRHIGMEEKILLPALVARGEDVAALARQLRLDHSALGAMMVPSPSPALVGRIVELLAIHDPLEEAEGGLYPWADEALAGDADVLDRLMRAPAPPVARHFDGERAHAAIDLLVGRAMAPRSGR